MTKLRRELMRWMPPPSGIVYAMTCVNTVKHFTQWGLSFPFAAAIVPPAFRPISFSRKRFADRLAHGRIVGGLGLA